MAMTRAFITGSTGQDGTYLARHLNAQGYEVHGLVRPGDPTPRDPDLITVHSGDLTDRPGMAALLDEIQPSQIYNLGGVTSVAFCWTEPVLAAEVNGTAAVFLMEAAWKLQEKTGQRVAFVQASSAEIFGEADLSPQNEATLIRPINPYGASKALAHLSVGVYRTRGLHASSLVLYNHESPLRPPSFVTRKITQGAAAIAKGDSTELRLGNLDARRDWGWAPDYVAAMVLAATHSEPDDFIIGTGEAHTVRDFVVAAFAAAGQSDWEKYVVEDPAFYRPIDSTNSLADASKAHRVLGWEPTVGFDELVGRMVAVDLGA
jgi:GDPmannose 4,6-dehydratase